MAETLLTVREASKALKVNVNFTYSLINSGLLPALKLGSLKIRMSSLERFLEEYEGKDLSDLTHIKDLKENTNEENA